ncbi:MAG TPA: Rpn family recombination-promoting nuclease/putative transposase, partial [Thermotogota bacterium]|nr:Rpn family recombination-promoting nuclease/putative transposase [Thermotogota bacterium]
MSQRYINPKVDYAFKRVFGNEQHPNILIAFLNAVFEYPADAEERITSVSIKNPYLDKRTIDDKLAILDIRAETNNNLMINIEIQVRRDEAMRKRTLYYLSNMVAEGLKASEDYSVLSKCVAINILDYTEIEESEKIHTSYVFMEKDEKSVLSTDMEIHFLELAKLRKAMKVESFDKFLQENPLYQWMLFIEDPEDERVQVLAGKKEGFKEAIDMVDFTNMTEQEKIDYWTRNKAMHERASIEAEKKRAEERAEERGVERGRDAKAVQIARKLVSTGMTIEQIAEITEIPIETLKDILKID